MDLSAPYTALVSEADGAVLTTLARTTRPLSGREIARLSRGAPSSTWRVLRRYVEHGLVIEEPAGGKTTLYRLNREHLAADAIVALTRLRTLLLERLRDQLSVWEMKPRHAFLYGSAARGDGTTDSDIDVLIVRPQAVAEDDPIWREHIDDLSSAIRRWTGNHAGLAELGERDLRRLKRERPPVVDEVVHDGISLFGDEPPAAFGRRG